MKTTLLLLLACCFFQFASAQGLPIPYYTGFDSSAEQSGWQAYQTGDIGSSEWGVGGGGFSLPECIGHDYNVGGAMTDTVVDWYVSPALHFTGPSLIALKVRTSGFSAPFVDNCELWYGTGNQNPALGDFQLLTNLSYMIPQGIWLDTSVTTNFVAENVYIAIKYKTIGAYWMTYSVDNINITNVTNGQNAPESTESLLNVFPNPGNSTLNFVIHEDYAGARFSICNSTGQEVKSIPINNSRKFQIQRDGLPTGIYFVRLMSHDKEICREKLVLLD